MGRKKKCEANNWDISQLQQKIFMLQEQILELKAILELKEERKQQLNLLRVIKTRNIDDEMEIGEFDGFSPEFQQAWLDEEMRLLKRWE